MMTSKNDRIWLQKYLGTEIIPNETQVQDLLIALARKVAELEKVKPIKLQWKPPKQNDQ